MSITNEKIRKTIGLPNSSSSAGKCRTGQYGLDEVLRLDVACELSTQMRNHHSAMPIHSYNVDASNNRCLFSVGRKSRSGMSAKSQTVATGVCAARDGQSFRNTSWRTRDSDRDKTGVGRRLSGSRRGQALLEMAFLIPLIVILIGGTISFGLFFFQANVSQQAVDVGAQEISRFPFPPEGTLGLGDLNIDPNDLTVLANDPQFKEQIYDEQFLFIRDSEWVNSFPSFNAFVAELPLLNRLLVPVMVRDSSFPDGVTRFPGAVVNNSAGEETVLIPIVAYDFATGAESLVEWVAPVEEILTSNGNGPYSLDATDPATSFVPGMVALRINFPVQSTTLINRTGESAEIIIEADDSSISDGNTGSNYSLAVAAESGTADTTIHSGRFGLGRQAALLREAGVRPYRRVLSVQSIYRREVFE